VGSDGATASSPDALNVVSLATSDAPVVVPRAAAISAAPEPVNASIVALSDLASLVSPFAGTDPTNPVEPPSTWALLAAARREIVGATQTTSTAAVAKDLSVSAAVVDTPGIPGLAGQPEVLAIPQTAPLAFLQQIPVVGPLLVTPIVAIVHQIPIISDIIHPFIGYPVQLDAPAGSPVARDVKVISFDGTAIYVHFMPAEGLQQGQTAPTIFDGPGLPLPGATNLDGAVLDGVFTDFLGQMSVATLRQNGYNVVTWDPRGEYNSGGVLQIDSPDFEARDVSAIISWAAEQPEVQLDGPGDPRMGMVGISYGGGIQLVTAAIDHRVDAIVPTIAWNTLNSSLYLNDAFKSGWGTLLGGLLVLTFARPNPKILPALVYGDLTSMLTESDQELLAERGPGGERDLVDQITAPTLLIQGTVDSLFSLQEADNNAQALMANGVPTKVLWFCGGHGLCTNNLFDFSDGAVITDRTLDWLDRYVKGDTLVDTGPQFEWVDQRGQYFSSSVYPAPAGEPIVASTSGAGVLPLIPFIGGSGPLLGVLPIGGTKAFNALNLTTAPATTTTYVVGAPQLTLTYSGVGLSRHVYAQLVDSTGMVLGNQVTPVPVTLDGQSHTVSVALQPVAETLRPGDTVTLQLVASAADYETIWSLGVLNVSSMRVTLPTANPAAVVLTA
jgi:ABC-2 type transport system ATP-binding protein